MLTSLLHLHYVVKIFLLLTVVIALNRIFRISFVLPFPRWINRMPRWLVEFVGVVERYGWTVIVAMILAGVWQIAEAN